MLLFVAAAAAAAAAAITSELKRVLDGLAGLLAC